MAKKRQRNKYTSKGQGSNINPNLVHAVRKDATYLDVIVTKTISWKKGQNPWVTVENPERVSQAQGDRGSNKPYIKIRANDLWGDPRRKFSMGAKKEDVKNEATGIQQG